MTRPSFVGALHGPRPAGARRREGRPPASGCRGRVMGAWEPAAEPAGPDRAAGGAGGEPGPRARSDPPRPDARFAVHVLSRRRADHGVRSGRHPAIRDRRPALRRRAPLELRRVRLARAADDVRHQRLRRDAPRTVGVGRQAPGGELRGRGSRARVLRGRPARGRRSRRVERLPAGHAPTPRAMRTLDAWYAHMEVEQMLEWIRVEVEEERLGKREAKEAEKDVAKARTRDSSRVFARLTGRGRRRAPDRRRPAADRADRGPRPARDASERHRGVDADADRARTGGRSRTTTTRSRSSATCTPRARSWASAASGPAPGSCCWSAATTTTRCSSRRRRRRPRSWSGSSARAATTTTAGASWRANA